MANTVIDALNNQMTTVNVGRGKYDDLLLTEKLWDDMCDLISIRAKQNKGITPEEVNLIYELHIKPVNDIEVCDDRTE